MKSIQIFNFKFQIKECGYTLIEVLIVLVITTTLFFGGFATYREFTRRQFLETTYKELRADLELAREFASSGEKPSGAGGCSGTLAGYTITFSSSGYTVAATCIGPATTSIVRTRTLQSGLTISGPNFMYKVLGQGTNLTGAGTVTISYPAIGKTLNATLTENGILQK